MVTNEEDKQFLLTQREKVRPGCMLGTDKKLAEKEEANQKIEADRTLKKENIY